MHMRGCAVLPTSWCSGHEDGVLFVIDTAEPCECWQLLPFLAATLPFLATTLPFLCWQLLPFLYWQLPLFLAATFAFPWCSLCLSLLAAYALLCCNVTKTCMQPKAAPVPGRSSTSLPEAALSFNFCNRIL